MKKILDFNNFINESLLGMHVAFTFIPVDSNFVSLDKDLVKSKTPLPSEDFKSGTHGYILLPTTMQTQELLLSPYFAESDSLVEGRIDYINNPSGEGIITNADSGPPQGWNPVPNRLTGKSSITSKIDGYSSGAGIFLKSGSALIAEMIMRNIQGWEKQPVSDLERKVLNGFPDNMCLSMNYWDGLETACQDIRALLAIASPDLGLNIKNQKVMDSYDVTEYLLEFFQKKSGDFVSMKFPPGVFEKISELAKQRSPEKNISQTIDNIMDLKSSGLFDD